MSDENDSSSISSEEEAEMSIQEFLAEDLKDYKSEDDPDYSVRLYYLSVVKLSRG